MVCNVTMITLWMTFLMNKFIIAIMMMDEFIHWPKPYLLLSATCDEILSWTIEIWMKNTLISDNNCNIVNLSWKFIPQYVYKE